MTAEISSESMMFEECLRELQQIAARLEDGSAGLEVSLQEFERGVKLLRVCYERLESAEQRIEQLVRMQDSGPELAPFDATATANPAAPVVGRRRGRREATGSLLPEEPAPPA